MSRFAVAALISSVVATTPALAQARCYNNADVTCPLRSELTVALGPSTDKLTLTGAWTTRARVGAYARLFPGLEPDARSEENATVTSEEAYEFGLSYRLVPKLTLGLGYARLQETERTFGAADPFTGIPILVDEVVSYRSGPSLLIAWAFHPPRRQIGLATTASVGPVGMGLSVGLSLRFIKGGATPGVE